MVDSPVRRVGHYCDRHEILIVGDGDFSFSLSLARGFHQAKNMVCTSLDNFDELMMKYQSAIPNVQRLLALGCTVMHGVDATKMRLLTDLKMRKFDRIVFNFPHAGFHGKEDSKKLIRMHKKLVGSFFSNAISLLKPYGEVHVSHKTSEPFTQWNIEELAKEHGFVLVETVNFESNDYPGYNHKRGSGKRSDEPFPLGECSTFKFQIRNLYRGDSSRELPKLVADIDHSGISFDIPHTGIELFRSGISQNAILVRDDISPGRFLPMSLVRYTVPHVRTLSEFPGFCTVPHGRLSSDLELQRPIYCSMPRIGSRSYIDDTLYSLSVPHLPFHYERVNQHQLVSSFQPDRQFHREFYEHHQAAGGMYSDFAERSHRLRDASLHYYNGHEAESELFRRAFHLEFDVYNRQNSYGTSPRLLYEMERFPRVGYY